MIKFRNIEQQDLPWVKRKLGVILVEDTTGLIAHDDETGRLLGACVADSFGPDSCYVHICIENPLIIRRGFLHLVADTLFNVCDLSRIFGLVPGDNLRALKFDKKIGFKEVAEVPDGFATGISYHIMRMDKANCRWLSKEIREAA